MLKKLKKIWKIYLLKDPFILAHRRWVKDQGDKLLRYNYNLDKNSIVFDLGGYKGEFAEKIYKKYNSNIYVFEPVKEYFEILETKFKNNEKIKVFNFGLSNKEEEIEISLNDDGSSTFIKDGEKEIIKLKDIITFLSENSIKEIDLFKINIEGGEFEVLPALIENDFIKNIGNLQIQFHNFINNAETKRDNIQKELNKTHKITYNYYFIWENWEKNER